MTTQDFQNRYKFHFTPSQVGEIMTDDQWKRCRQTGHATAIKETSAEIATWVRCKSAEEVQAIVDEQIKAAQ